MRIAPRTLAASLGSARGFARLRARFGLFEVYADIDLGGVAPAEALRAFECFVDYLGSFSDERLRGMM